MLFKTPFQVIAVKMMIHLLQKNMLPVVSSINRSFVNIPAQCRFRPVKMFLIRRNNGIFLQYGSFLAIVFVRHLPPAYTSSIATFPVNLICCFVAICIRFIKKYAVSYVMSKFSESTMAEAQRVTNRNKIPLTIVCIFSLVFWNAVPTIDEYRFLQCPHL